MPLATEDTALPDAAPLAVIEALPEMPVPEDSPAGTDPDEEDAAALEGAVDG